MAALTSAGAAPGRLAPTRLRCEYAENPLGTDAARPRLSWELQSGRRGDRQSAYQILVASTPAKLSANRPDLWNSGKVTSAETLHVLYAGKPLASGTRAYWKVRVWDGAGKAAPYSEPAWWEMGLLAPDDWHGTWIADSRPAPQSEEEMFGERPAPLFRKEFALSKAIRRARAYVSGLGYYELTLNGRRVGDHLLDPAWTAYSRRVFYSTYDVTDALRKGQNAAGLMLGNGWYDPLPLRMWGHLNLRDHLAIGRPRAILELRVEYADGTRETIATGPDWRVGDGPLLKNNLYLGEVYDARREVPGWDRPGFDDSGWRPAVQATEPVGPLQAQPLPPIRATATLKPVKVTEPVPGTAIFDMGQNFAGWVRLRVQGPSGTRVQLRYGELLKPDGTLNGLTSVCGQIKGRSSPGAPAIAWQSDTYILKGEGVEEYTPRFTWHGFRYVEVTGYPGTPAPDALEGYRLNSDVQDAGAFACSNEMLNRIQEMCRWTQLSNIFSVQSDCPHRERFGYGGDLVADSEMGILNFDMARFYEKVVHDFADAARPNGGMTETAPFVGIQDAGMGGGAGPVGWGTAFPLLQWQLYQYYGNRRLLEEQYDAGCKWMALLEAHAKDGILDNGISDHESLAPKPRALTGTAFYYLNARLMSQIAGVLGRAEDAARYSRLADGIRDAFNRQFLGAGGRYAAGTQACQAFALDLGLAPAEQQDAALQVLVDDILKAHDGHLTTGIFGTRYMLDALSAAGRADVAYTIATQKTFPGWGYMLENGATTLWEHWAFSDNTFSHNHPMFGSVSEWMIKWLAGIQPAPNAVGFDKIVIRPQVVGDLTWAEGAYHSVRGRVTSSWRRDGDRLTLEVGIPPNTTATVFVPAGKNAHITESGRPAENAPGVEILRPGVYRVGGGKYRFEAGG